MMRKPAGLASLLLGAAFATNGACSTTDAMDGPQAGPYADAAVSGEGGPTSSDAGEAGNGKVGIAQINHLVVIVLENWSFDSLYGELAGADGVVTKNAGVPQTDPATNTAYATLPEVDDRIPATLPNKPFALDPYFGIDAKTQVDPTQKFYEEQQQINGGKMDRYVAVSSAKGLAMGFFHTADLPLAAVAMKYVVCDHFYHSAFGGSFLSHQWLIAAATPTFPNAPAAMRAVLDTNGVPVVDPTTGKPQDGPVTPDGYVVGTAISVQGPHPTPPPPAEQLVPAQTQPTIGDRLSAAAVDWAWYSGGWNDAVAGTANPATQFQFHHQPFAYFANYAEGTPARAAHLKDETDFTAAAHAGTLPPVSFVKPSGVNDEHPNRTDVITGEMHVLQLIDAVRSGPNASDSAIIVVYDENGGFADHSAPPAGDRWGPGTRVPAIVIAPFGKKSFVDHTAYETTSVLALIEHRWGLAPLTTRDGASADLSNAFEGSP
jgi:acid phosphatase